MSPHQWLTDRPRSRFPRVSGDEPRAEEAPDDGKEFSPRERG